MEQKETLSGIAFALTALSVALCTFMEVLDLSITNVAIPYIAGDLGVSNNTGTWVITFFMVGNAIVLPIAGWLSAKIGAIRLIILSSLLFGVLSAVCGLSVNFPMLVIARFFQGVVAGPLIPMSQNILIRIFPEGKENVAMAVWAVVLLVGPIAGPVVGGWLTASYGWRWIFFINLPVAAFAFLVIYVYMKNKMEPFGKNKFDWWGLIFLSIGVTCLQIFLDQGRQLDWFHSGVIRALFGISIISLVLLAVYEWNHKNPLVDVRLFKISSFTIGTLVLALSFLVFYSTVVITPLWLEDFMGYTALKAGLCLGTIGVAPLLCAPLVARAMGGGRLKLMVGTSLFMLAICSFYLASFNTTVSFTRLAWSRFLFGVAAAFYIAPASMLPLVKIPKDKKDNAAGIMQFFRIFLGGAGTAIFTSMWNDRATFHRTRIGDVLTDFNQTLINLKKLVMNQLGMNLSQYYAYLNDLLNSQAYMLSTNDMMLIVGVILLFTTVMLSFVGVTPEECKASGKASH